MRDFFADDSLLIVPSHPSQGVRLIGEVLGTHKGALVMAVTDQCSTTHEITIDLTSVHYFANSALEILVALANNLQPPKRLVVHAAPELALRDRLIARGWDRIEALQLIDG
ncbi:hypothetical protein [Streptomyces sp. NPDC057302]|uniref:hypothetical protein n=1 Tax=Streptomyces sp. NPDC057302 TaxID=3346094 RepID=UPI00363073F8